MYLDEKIIFRRPIPSILMLDIYSLNKKVAELMIYKLAKYTQYVSDSDSNKVVGGLVVVSVQFR